MVTKGWAGHCTRRGVLMWGAVVLVMFAMDAAAAGGVLETIIDFSPNSEKHASHNDIVQMATGVDAMASYIGRLESYEVAATRDSRIDALKAIQGEHVALRDEIVAMCLPVTAEHEDVSRRAYQEREHLKVSEALLRDPNQDVQFLDHIEQMLGRSAEKLESLETQWKRTATTVQACKALTTAVEGFTPRLSALRLTVGLADAPLPPAKINQAHNAPEQSIAGGAGTEEVANEDANVLASTTELARPSSSVDGDDGEF